MTPGKIHDSLPPDIKDEKAKLELEDLLNDGKRGQAYKKHIHNIVILGLYVVGYTLLIMIIIRAWHFVVPSCLQWLDDTQVANIERIVFSGIIVTLSGQYFKKYKITE